MGETDDPGAGIRSTCSSGKPRYLIQDKGNRGFGRSLDDVDFDKLSTKRTGELGTG